MAKLCWLFGLVGLLVACNPVGATPTVLLYPTATPPAFTPEPLNLVAGCESGDLDNWSERAFYLSDAFGEVMVQTVNTPQENWEPLIGQLYTYKQNLNALSVPEDCAQETHRLFSSMAAEVIYMFEAARTDSSVDVRSVVARAQATLQLVQTRIDELMTQMQATYDAAGS